MKTELTPRGRSIVSGLAAAAVTTVLVSTLVEALNPALLFSDSAQVGPQAIAAASARRDGGTSPEA